MRRMEKRRRARAARARRIAETIFWNVIGSLIASILFKLLSG